MTYPREAFPEDAGGDQGGAVASRIAFADRSVPAVRSRIVRVAFWGIAHARRIHYDGRRPIDGLNEPFRLPLYTDCSGFVSLCYSWARAPDPNGLAFSGEGYTGTLLRHLSRIERAEALVADIVVWGKPPGHHVALVVRPGDDPLLASHGMERGPVSVVFSEENRFQPSPAAWLTLWPADGHRIGEQFVGVSDDLAVSGTPVVTSPKRVPTSPGPRSGAGCQPVIEADPSYITRGDGY